MVGSNQRFEGHWLSRIDEYRHTPRIIFGIGAVDRAGELAKEFAKNTNAIIITDKELSKIGLVDSAKESLEGAGFKVDVFESKAREPEISEVKKITGLSLVSAVGQRWTRQKWLLLWQRHQVS